MYLGDWIERWAAVEPRRVALVVGETGERIDYGELDRRVLCCERWLRESAGVARGDRVAVLAKNRAEHIELFFACARLGAILVPLNWRLAAPEVAFIIGHCSPSALLYEEELAGLVPPDARGVRRFPERGAVWHQGQPSDRGLDLGRVDPSLPAMILYTSGTTGRPKGAVLTHGSIGWNAVNTSLSWDLSGRDTTLTHTPFFHTGGWHVFTTPLLHRGGRVVMTRAFDPALTLDLVDRESISVMFAVPTMFASLADQPGFARSRLDTLRFMISGGAPCPPDLVARYRERGIRFKQGYGLTEVGPNCFVISLDEADQRPDAVGRPIHHEEVRVIDEAGAEVPSGSVGELLLRGPHVCAGYWNDSAASAAVIKDGWFWTGDLVRRDATGLTWVVGRRKEMYKSGGENVYPAEVERVLLLHPSVRQAAVVPMAHPHWGEVGRAFVVAQPGVAVDAAALADHCRIHLAKFKVPQRFELVEQLPLTTTGKIAKEELRVRPVV